MLDSGHASGPLLRARRNLSMCLRCGNEGCLLSAKTSSLFVHGTRGLNMSLNRISCYLVSRNRGSRVNKLPTFLRIGRGTGIVLSSRVPKTRCTSIEHCLRSVAKSISFRGRESQFIFVGRSSCISNVRICSRLTRRRTRPLNSEALLVGSSSNGFMGSTFHRRLTFMINSILFANYTRGNVLGVLRSVRRPVHLDVKNFRLLSDRLDRRCRASRRLHSVSSRLTHHCPSVSFCAKRYAKRRYCKILSRGGKLRLRRFRYNSRVNVK